MGKGNSSGHGTQGIAWMAFIVVLALAFTSPAMRTSMDQAGRENFSSIELKKQNLERQAAPVESWNENTFGPLEKALGEASQPKSGERTPSTAGILN